MMVTPPPGLWAQLPNTKLTPALDPRFYVSGPQAIYNPRDIFANSGGDLAMWNGKLGFFLSGGGHAATPDNSLFFLPLDGSGPQRLLGPYYRDDGQYKQDTPVESYLPFGVWTDAPRSRHTYSALIYAEKLGKPIVFGYSGGVFTGAGGGTDDPRWVDLSLTFDQQMARPDMGWQRTALPPWPGMDDQAGWDPVTKKVVIRVKGSIGAYSPDTDTWEDWHLPSDAGFGSDFNALVAMDIAGRWMYVLGDSVVERYHLDTHAYESLRNRPWAAPFGVRNFGPPSYPSFGLGWHDRTKQLVVLVWLSNTVPGPDDSAKQILLIDPATDTVTTLAMGGDLPLDPGIYGSYGRFRVIPGTDQVVAVSLTDFNANIGTLPIGAPVPSRIALTPGTWLALPTLPGFAAGLKHMTGATNPGDGRLYWQSGDHGGAPFTVPDRNASYRQETYSLDLVEKLVAPADPVAGWRLEYPYCGPGPVQPKHPDYVGWTWDTIRKVFWMVPGEMVMSGDNCPGESLDGQTDPGFPYAQMMTFDPVAKQWAVVGPSANWGQSWGAVHDPVTDALFKFRWDGGWGNMLSIYHIGTKTWEDVPMGFSTTGTQTREARLGNSVVAVDYVARVIYAYDTTPGNGHFFRLHMDTRAIDDLGPAPGVPTTIGYQAVLVWDSVNGVLLWYRPNEFDLNTGVWLSDGEFWAYHPDTAKWESLSISAVMVAGVSAVPTFPLAQFHDDGVPPQVASAPSTGPVASGLVMAFNPQQNAVVMLPRANTGLMYLYRYAAGSTPPPPPPPPPPPIGGTMATIGATVLTADHSFPAGTVAGTYKVSLTPVSPATAPIVVLVPYMGGPSFAATLPNVPAPADYVLTADLFDTTPKSIATSIPVPVSVPAPPPNPVTLKVPTTATVTIAFP